MDSFTLAQCITMLPIYFAAFQLGKQPKLVLYRLFRTSYYIAVIDSLRGCNHIFTMD